ncbi:MAG: MarR family winged helix-turn-helix transcriptional regulator [Kiloniellaceae bacterium]
MSKAWPTYPFFPFYTTGLLHDTFGHLFRRCHLRSQQAFTRVFGGYGVTPLQYGILELVSRNPGITHRELAEAMVTAPSVVTTAMKALHRDGLLDLTPLSGDARHRHYRLSKAGENLFVLVQERIFDAEELLVGPLTPAERRSLKRLLRRLAESERL